MSQLTWGIVFAVLSVTVYTSGMVLEKAATRRLPPVHTATRCAHDSCFLTTILFFWLTGFALLLLGLGFQVLALTSAPISIVQTVAACGIALFLVLSHFVLGDRLTKIEYLGIATMLVALLLLGLSVDSNDELVIRLTSLAAILAVGIPALAVGVLLFLCHGPAEGKFGVGVSFSGPAVRPLLWAPVRRSCTGSQGGVNDRQALRPYCWHGAHSHIARVLPVRRFHRSWLSRLPDRTPANDCVGVRSGEQRHVKRLFHRCRHATLPRTSAKRWSPSCLPTGRFCLDLGGSAHPCNRQER